MSQQNSGPRRVLLVEDDRQMATSLATLLEASGYEVEMVCDGEAALETVELFNPDVCLIDVNVPKLDVYELSRRLREQLGHPVLLANVTPFRDRDEWDSEAEFDLDFSKPCDAVQVVAQLSDCLRSDMRHLSTKVHNIWKQGKPRMPGFRR